MTRGVDEDVVRSGLVEVAARIAVGCMAQLRLEEARLTAQIGAVERASDAVNRAAQLLVDTVRAKGRGQ